MDNQHRQIKGYRELNMGDIEQINSVKAMGGAIENLLTDIGNRDASYDRRWISIAKTHFQEGLMALTRAIARPEGF